MENHPSAIILADRSYFAQRYPLVNYLKKKKNIFTSFSDSYFFGNLRKFGKEVFVRLCIRQVVQNLLREPSNGKVLKLLQLTPNLIRHKNNHSVIHFNLDTFFRHVKIVKQKFGFIKRVDKG